MSDVSLVAPSATVIIAAESWDEFWPEAEALAREHWDEVEDGVEARRPFAPDAAKMRALNIMGVLQVYSARRAGVLVGYATWQIMPDIESAGLLIAQQGAWFVSPSAKSQTIGYRLFEFSLVSLRLLGVKMLFPHHRTQGRGKDLGKFFARWGAKHTQNTYSLWIGES